MTVSLDHIQGLDIAAWERWVAFRKAIKKPIKEASYGAMALKLSRFGADQAEVVDQSISNQWQGLFELTKKKSSGEYVRGAKPEKTEKQKAADAAAHEEANHRAERAWDEIVKTPEGKLLLADALLARYSIRQYDENMADSMEFLRDRVGPLIREADPVKVAGDPRISSMVRTLYGERAFRKLKDNAKAAEVSK
jgi:hypothetical protein